MKKQKYQIAVFSCECGNVHIDVADPLGEKVRHTDIVKALRDAANFIDGGKANLLDVRPHRTH